MPSWQPYGGPLWTAACVLPPSAVSLFSHVLLKQESIGAGLTWSSLWQVVTVEGQFRGMTVLGALALDVLLYAALTWYLDKVGGLDRCGRT